MADDTETDFSMKLKPEPERTRRKGLTGEDQRSKASQERAVLTEARERAAYAKQWWSANFREAEDDVRFANGGDAQWDPEALMKRRGSQRPAISINTMNQYLDQILGEQRQAKPAIHIAPADDTGASVEFSVGKMDRRVRGAELYEGLIRGIEYKSQAESHYDTAFMHAVDGGFGWLRAWIEYANDRSFDQEVRISALRNRWSALIDPDAMEPDYSDAGYGFIFTSMPRAEFERRYAQAVPGVLAGATAEEARFWMPGGKITVAEYLTREAVPRDLVRLTDGTVAWLDEVTENGALMPELRGAGIEIAEQRETVSHCTYWRLVTAWSVLQGPIKLPFTTIPLVPVLGKEKALPNNEVVYRSLIRDAKQPKQVHNVMVSSYLERMQSAPKSPWVVTDRAVEDYADMWKKAASENAPYLVYREGTTPPQREPGPAMPVAEIQVAAIMLDQIKATIGMYDASVGARSNETSGKAINARQREADNASYVFLDNLNRAVMRVGRLVMEAIPEIYDSDRILRFYGPNGASDWVNVNKVVKTVGADGKERETTINPIGSGEFDVVVKSGPAYGTQRAEAVDMLLEFMRVAPNVSAVVMDKVAENSDWPGAREIAQRLKRMLAMQNPQLMTAEEREEMGQDMPQQQPDPEQQAAAAKSQADIAGAKADMAKAEAEKAQAAATMAEVERDMRLMENQGELRTLVESIIREFNASTRGTNGRAESAG